MDFHSIHVWLSDQRLGDRHLFFNYTSRFSDSIGATGPIDEQHHFINHVSKISNSECPTIPSFPIRLMLQLST